MSDSTSELSPSPELAKVAGPFFRSIPNNHTPDDNQAIANLKQLIEAGNENARAALNALQGPQPNSEPGRHAIDDAKNLRWMGWLLVSGNVNTVWDAAKAVAGKIVGPAKNIESITNRLHGKFKKEASKYIRESVSAYIAEWAHGQRAVLSQAVNMDTQLTPATVDNEPISTPENQQEIDSIWLRMATLGAVIDSLLSNFDALANEKAEDA